MMSRNVEAVITENVSPEKMLKEGKTIQIRPTGYSMYPLIYPDRDEVVLAPIRGRKLKWGDVVIFRRKDGLLILHRIFKIRKQGYYIIGDNSPYVDGPINIEDICGIMTGFYHKGHYYSEKNVLYKASAYIWLILRPVRGVISKAAHGLKSLIKH